ncbi:hypothetical protein BDK51DRAFT_23334 [Blyttiomyces helicus]|uniref:PCI domain-containing protein n=1 Tax=Blyttiomyces helicus TaxID=388810 RepID=A0A4P9VX57_9FUNG|nr:hypothetical protein BDK51DRAFT_23334 [Blyttiomyces helicus]|eukprot:RKO83812.1 hypothetical protein BDK51DRAFT_23334 [Blyttiomyces helicus]
MPLGSKNMCNSTRHAITKGTELPSIDLFPIADQVTFKYYTGVLAFFEENYAVAESELSFAFDRCMVGGADAERLILSYLIPIRFLKGCYPHQDLFTKYPAMEHLYGDFALAIRRGDLGLFDRAFDRLQRPLCRRGTWFTVEKAREVVIATMMKKVWMLENSPTRLPLTKVQQALRLSGNDSDIPEVECVVANLIDKGFVRGYIAHQSGMIVLAADGRPFVAPQTVAAASRSAS